MTSTPWGPSQSATRLAVGIMDYTTASHGGIHLSDTRRQELAYRLGFWAGPTDVPAWYEEDCDWAIPYYLFHCDDARPDGEGFHEGDAIRTIAHWHPELLERLGLSYPVSPAWAAKFDRSDHRAGCVICRMVTAGESL